MRTHDFVAIGIGPFNLGPRLPDRPDRGARRRVPRPQPGVRLAPGHDARGAARCRRRSWPTWSRSPTRRRRSPSSTTRRSPATSTRSTSARASTRCAASTTTTAAGRPRSSTPCASGARCTRRARRRRLRRPHERRDLPRPPPRARHRHAAARPVPEPRASASTARTTSRQGRAAGDAGIAVVGGGQSAGRDLLRPARGDRPARVRADLDHPLRALLPARVHEVDARDDLAGVHGVLPPPPAAGARRPRGLAGPALQGHRRRR